MLRVATWNVENFFHPDAEAEQAQQDAFEAKLEAIVGKVQVVDADVWALQEVGGQQALDDLAAALPGDWHTMLSSHEDGRGIAVGYLSREELHDQVDVVDLPAQLSGGRADDEGHLLTQMGRGALQVRLHSDGGDVILINCHLKSKLLTYPGGRFSPRDEDERARYGVCAQPSCCRGWRRRCHVNSVLNKDGDRAVIVLGDLNDSPDAATTQLLLGPTGSETGTRGETIPDQGDAWRLWNLAALIPEQTRYSRIYRGRGELIDHLLVSQGLPRIAGQGLRAQHRREKSQRAARTALHR